MTVEPQYLHARPNLEVPDVESALTFFRDVLGFEVRATMGAPLDLALVFRDSVDLALVRADRPAVPSTTSCYLDVSGVEALYEHCRRRGVKIAFPLTEHPWGMKDFGIEAPGDHCLALGERLSTVSVP